MMILVLRQTNEFLSVRQNGNKSGALMLTVPELTHGRDNGLFTIMAAALRLALDYARTRRVICPPTSCGVSELPPPRFHASPLLNHALKAGTTFADLRFSSEVF
jgi:hypothetical protein